jgi:hypothetical protein
MPRWRRLRWPAAAILAVAVAAGAFVLYSKAGANPGCEVPRGSSECTRVFFIGNSYTSVNDLPYMFAGLAWSGGHRVETAIQAPGGWTLLDHSTSPQTAGVLAGSRWDYVVLQEQSEIPSIESDRQSLMYPAARDLVSLVRGAGASPVFFVTWAHRDGWPGNGMPDYTSMQTAIDDGYLFIAHEQHAAIAPVGFAWSEVVGQEASPDLWQGDGSHPTTKGTYLAACVFYATIFRASPVGLTYHPWLSDGDAAQAQQAAAATVLDDPLRWGLS